MNDKRRQSMNRFTPFLSATQLLLCFILLQLLSRYEKQHVSTTSFAFTAPSVPTHGAKMMTAHKYQSHYSFPNHQQHDYFRLQDTAAAIVPPPVFIKSSNKSDGGSAGGGVLVIRPSATSTALHMVSTAGTGADVTDFLNQQQRQQQSTVTGSDVILNDPACSTASVAASYAVPEQSSPSENKNAMRTSLDVNLLTQPQERFFPMPLPLDASADSNPGGSVAVVDPAVQGRILAIAAAALCGTNFATVKMLNGAMPAGAGAAFRFTVAAAAVTAVVLWKEFQQDTRNRSQLGALIVDDTDIRERGPATLFGFEVGIWYCIAYLSQALGLQTVDASKSSFFTAAAVVVVPVLDACLRQKRLGWNGIAAVSFALAGVALLQLGPSILPPGMIGGNDAVAATNHIATTLAATATSNAAAAHHSLAYHGVVTQSLSSMFSQGDLFCFAQALFFGIGYFRLEDVSNKYPKQADRITSGQLMAVAVGAIAYFLAHDGVPSIDAITQWLHNPFILRALLWTGMGSTALALYLETLALQAVSASEMTVLMTSVSVFGSAFAYMTMGEVLPPIGMIGGALIMCGCAMTSIGPKGQNCNTESGMSKIELDSDNVN